MDQIFRGVNFTGVGVVGSNGLTAAQALRRSTATNTFIANGDVGGFANFINTNATLVPGGQPGALLLNAGLPQNFFVVSPQYGSVVLWDNSNNSTYHSLQAHITKRTSAGLTGQFSYTYSKALGDNGTIRTSGICSRPKPCCPSIALTFWFRMQRTICRSAQIVGSLPTLPVGPSASSKDGGCLRLHPGNPALL